MQVKHTPHANMALVALHRRRYMNGYNQSAMPSDEETVP